MSDKIINTFQQRRQLTDDILNLAKTTNELELVQAAKQIIHSYPTDLVINLMLKHLETPDSQLRGGLGHLALLLPPEEISPALRNAVAKRQNSTQTRLTAALLLERFLKEEVSPALISDINDMSNVAYQSLCQAVEEGRRNRHVFLEYITQMREESDDIAFMVMDMLERLPAIERIEFLRLMVQDDREAVATEALSRLEKLPITEVGTQAARALHILQLTLSPELAERAQRSLRKLQFTGTRYEPAEATLWRSLISPSESNGNQTVWLIREPAKQGEWGTLINIVTNTQTGILAFYCNEEVAAADIPQHQAVGEMATIPITDRGSAIFLEAPFDYGRWLIHEALQSHWQGRAWRSLFGEYTLYNDLIWQFHKPCIDTHLEALFQAPKSSDMTEESQAAERVIVEQSAQQLLAHPAMQGWILQNQLILQTLKSNLSGISGNQLHSFTDVAAILLQNIKDWPDGETLLTGMEAGLRVQAAWLQIANEPSNAKKAQICADGFQQFTPTQNPFLLTLFDQAAQGLQQAAEKVEA